MFNPSPTLDTPFPGVVSSSENTQGPSAGLTAPTLAFPRQRGKLRLPVARQSSAHRRCAVPGLGLSHQTRGLPASQAATSSWGTG